jgi:hypothetical protein
MLHTIYVRKTDTGVQYQWPDQNITTVPNYRKFTWINVFLEYRIV